MSTSTAEAEHIAASSCCAQILRLRNQLQSYGLVRSKMHIMYDNARPYQSSTTWCITTGSSTLISGFSLSSYLRACHK